jgi:hypothetical protein
VFTGEYGAFVGGGVLKAVINGDLQLVAGFVGPALSTGTEMIGVSSTATSFTNNSPATAGTAAAGSVLPVHFSGLDTHEGDYLGQGTLTGVLTWGGLAVGMEEFFLPTSAEYIAEVPAPATLSLLALGLFVLGARRLR